MRIFIISLSVILVSLLFLTLFNIKLIRKDTRGIRESYALATVSSAIMVLFLTLLAVIPVVGYIDSILYFAEIGEGYLGNLNIRGICFLSIVVTGLAAAFIILYKSIRAHKDWNGAKSERQARLDSEWNWNNSFINDAINYFIDARIRIFSQKYRHELKLHRTEYANETVYDEAAVASAWYKEFAAIYQILEPRILLSENNHWYADNNCYVFPFDKDKYVAALVCDDVPSESEQEVFTRFLSRLGHEYFTVIIAVKNNPDEQGVIPIQKNGFDISIYFKSNMLDRLVNFNDYYDAIRSKLHEQVNPDSELTLKDVYTPLHCVESVKGRKTKYNVDEYVNNWLNENSRRQLAILGDYGQGKTTTAVCLAVKLIESDSKRVPLYISLSGKSPRNNTPLEILTYFSTEYNINPQALQILNNNGRLLLIFDGFDEMDYVGDASLRQNHFRNIWKLATKSTKMIITGRPNFFFDTDEIKNVFGSNISNNNVQHCTALKLCPFDMLQISKVLSSVDEDTRTGIMTVLEKSKSKQFFDLISRPSNLSLVIQIWKPRNLIERYKNLSAASIIDEFIQDSYERQLIRSERKTQNVLSTLERDYFMLGIALKMYASHTIEIDNKSINETILHLVQKFPNEISNKSPVYIDLRNGKTLLEYFKESHTREAIMTDIRTCGILVLNEPKNIFEFAHKSFYDLLIAKCFLGRYLPKNNPYYAISQSVFAQTGVSIRKLRKNDTTQKKLLAELLVQAMNDYGHHSAQNPNAMFRQCYSFIVTSIFPKSNPSKEYRKFLKVSAGDGAYQGDNEGDFDTLLESSVPRKEIKRFIAIPAILLSLCLIAFSIRTLSTIKQFGENASELFTQETTAIKIDAIANNGSVPIGEIWIVMSVIVVSVILMFVVQAFYKRYKKRYIENVNALFFTWYYALKELDMRDEDIISCIDEPLRESFVQFIATAYFDGTEGIIKYDFDDEAYSLD